MFTSFRVDASTAFFSVVLLLASLYALPSAEDAVCDDGHGCIAQQQSSVDHVVACICHCGTRKIWAEHVKVALWSCDLYDPDMPSDPEAFHRSLAKVAFHNHPEVVQVLVEVSCHDPLRGTTMTTGDSYYRNSF